MAVKYLQHLSTWKKPLTSSNTVYYSENSLKEIYIDDLISQLRRNRTGCWVNGNYVGVIVYADNIVLLSHTIDGLQEMIHTCSTYAKNHNLSFSTHDNPRKSKTKCMAFLKKKRDLKKLALGDKELPWVNSVNHLGTTLTLDMGQDLLQKRA